jgi:hypothetical protein
LARPDATGTQQRRERTTGRHQQAGRRLHPTPSSAPARPP